jgi:hypothetical protein
MELETVERKSPQGRDGGLPGKAGFIGLDESQHRKIHSSVGSLLQSIMRSSRVLAMVWHGNGIG